MKAAELIESLHLTMAVNGKDFYKMYFADDVEKIVTDLCTEIETLKKANEPNDSKCSHLADMSKPNAILIQSIIKGLDYVDCTIGYEGIPLPCIETVAENVMINVMAKFNLFSKQD